jgi:crotonobetaine/carnitine-CoA ligase
MAAFDPLTLAGVVQEHALQRPDFVFITFEGAGVRPDDTRTYQQLWHKGQRIAAGLQKLGLQPGDKVGTLLANHAELVDLMLACSLTGVTLVPIDPRTRGDKLIHMLSAAHCKGAIIGDYALAEMLTVRSQISDLQWVVGLTTDEAKVSATEMGASGVTPFDTLSGDYASHARFPGSLPDAAMELLYTSGTTGDPKGIVMTHRRYVETAKILPQFFGFQADERLYSGLSLTHANAQLITLGTALVHALPCVISRRFSKSRLWDITRQYACTNFTLLGGMTTAIYAEPVQANDADNPVRTIISAGMPAAIWPDFARRFNVQLYEFYGAAEGGLSGNPPGKGPVGSIGKPAGNLDYRLVDEEGQDVQPNAKGERIGELLFRPKDGSPFKVEYHGNPQASAKKCAGGWLHMGDVVRVDADGWLYFMFRKGGGIRRNGDFIDAAFIEKLIAEVPAIDDVYVYGIPAANGVPGEKDVVAAVVPKAAERAGLDVQALFALCRQRLEANFVPTYIQVLEQIPKTASEKPQDRFLVDALSNDPASVYREVR